jgi:peptide subunit release factor 1 (eRF1)
MITREQLDRLFEWRTGAHPVVSVYLNTDKRRFTGTEYQKVLHDMLKATREDLAASRLARDHEREVLEDFARIEGWISHQFRNDGKPGLAAFASGAAGLWLALPLPRPVPDLVVVDDAPFMRPLRVLIDEFDRFCAAVVDRRRGRLFEIFMGEIQEIADVVDDVPAMVRTMGHQLKAETAVTRHIGEHYRAHYKNVAERLLHVFDQRRFDWILVGGPPADVPEFEKTLHSYLQQRIAGRLSVQVGLESTPAEVLRQAREIEKKLVRERERKLVETLLTQAHSGKLGVVGLADTLRALRNGQVHTLVFQDGLRAAGVHCPACRFVGLGESDCPVCQKPAEPTEDVVDLAIGEAMRQGCEVRHVFEAGELDSVGDIGALLRFRI